jgi:nitrous oxide reductase accessory protein NosL
MFDESKHAEHLAFDRCSPGAYAFARRQDAQAFARQNGGVVVQLQELMEGVPQ